MPPKPQLDQAVVQLFDDRRVAGTALAAAWLEQHGDEPELDTVFPLSAWTLVAENLQAGHL